jgi:mono/diheme cytochrome c family protein
MRPPPVPAWLRRCAVPLAALAATPLLATPLDDARFVNAWRTLRIVDCARCHGKDYEGSSGPSIVAFARTQSRERFVGAVLDGNPGRGMPGYRGNALVAAAIDDLHHYFSARADGRIGADDRPPAP